MDTREHMSLLTRSGHPGVAVQSSEEPRVMADIISLAKKLQNRQLVVWGATDGLEVVSPTSRKLPDTNDLGGALQTVLPALRKGAANIEAGKFIEPGRPSADLTIQDSIIVLRDISNWPFDRDPLLTRILRDILMLAPQAGTTVFITGVEYRPHRDFERLVTVIDYDLPDSSTIKMICEAMASSFKDMGVKTSLEPTPDVIRSLSGLTTSEIENALSLSVIETGGFDALVLQREKVGAVKRGGLLEVVPPFPGGIASVGGLEELKEWLRKRAGLSSPEAKAFGAPQLKATLLVGPPGSGKSATAKCIGEALRRPLLRLDVGAVFNQFVGASEANIRAAIKQAEAMAPCAVWVDEVEKALAGSSGAANDGGVTRRVVGTLLTAMQESAKEVFWCFTANDVTSLPPELMRKGRVDEIWFVDLPNQEERRAIFAIHLGKKKRDPSLFDLDALSVATAGFVGAEIEQVVLDAIIDAWDAGTDITTELMISAASRTNPMSVTAKEKIDAVRDWAKTRARAASRAEDSPATIMPNTARRKISNLN